MDSFETVGKGASDNLKKRLWSFGTNTDIHATIVALAACFNEAVSYSALDQSPAERLT